MRKDGRWEGTRGRMEEPIMCGRERAEVADGGGLREGVEEGNERGRDGARQGWSEEEKGGRMWTEEGGSEEEREQGREGNVMGGTLMRTLASIQYTAHKTTHNAALALETLVLQLQMLNGYNIL